MVGVSVAKSLFWEKVEKREEKLGGRTEKVPTPKTGRGEKKGVLRFPADSPLQRPFWGDRLGKERWVSAKKAVRIDLWSRIGYQGSEGGGRGWGSRTRTCHILRKEG